MGGFDVVLVVLAMLSSFVSVYLISQDPEFLTSHSFGAACDPGPEVAELTCPTATHGTVCSGRGSCLADACACDEGWVGDDCSQRFCPDDCSGRGTCYDGYCVCDNGWAGVDCRIDRLNVTTDRMMDGVDLEAFSDSSDCHFLSREVFQDDNSKDGKLQYFSPASNQMETYRFPLDKMRALPRTCPDHNFERCAFVGNSGTMKYSTYGKEIDGHDMVYRFNQAPTVGYEKHVGSRATFESLNAKHAHNLLRQDTKWNWRDPVPTYLLFEPLKLKETLTDIHDKFPEVKVLLLSPAFFRKVSTHDGRLSTEASSPFPQCGKCLQQRNMRLHSRNRISS